MKELGFERYAEKYLDAAPRPAGAFRLCESEKADFALPKREARSHKYSHGRALLLSGARGYSGAPVLAARACERGGAGLTRLLVPESVYEAAALRCDGAVVSPLPADRAGRFALSARGGFSELLKTASACLVGPGLGIGAGPRLLVRDALREAACPLVLDADALTLCAGETARFDECRAPLLLTPHEGEFRRLGGALAEGRLAGALRFAAEHPGVILILKGYGTLICRGAEVCVNPTGGPSLAKGGTGDVLAGLLCALLAQGFEPWFAARCAVWLHGRAGELAAAETGDYCLAPSDLIERLPRAFRELGE